MRPQPAETPIAFIRSIVWAYERYGLDPSEALNSAQIPPSYFDRADARVTAEQMEVFTGAAMRELDDEGLGWFSRRLPWGSNGMLCRASLPSTNLRVALSRWCRHYRLLIDDVRLELTSQGTTARFVVHELVDLGVQREFCLVSMLRNVHGYSSWLIDSRIPLVEATFPFAPPDHAKAYAFMFRCPILFGAPVASFSFDAEYLKLPARRDDADLRQMLLRPLPLIVLQYRRDRLLARRVVEILRSRGDELRNAETLAAALNQSTRSLYRHLAEEGSSLQQLKDQARRESAVYLMTHTRKPLKQVAVAAGFRSEASFSRAFRQWTGQSPGAFRQSTRAGR